MSTPTNLHERCGIITASLCDPLSLLINKIMGLKEDDPNAVGFYYEASIHGVNKYTVTLFNIYDNDPIPWLRLGYTMDLLLASPFVTRLTFYPLLTNRSENEGPLLSRATMSYNKRNNRLEEMFRVIVIETISNNATSIHDKHISYTSLLLKLAGIANEETDTLTSKLITGYSLINRVLLSLMKIRELDLTKISSSIIPCPLLRKPVSICAPRENANEGEIRFVIEESRREITKLVAIFVDLYTSHELFRNNILSLRTSGRLPTNFDGLMSRETELVSHIVGGLQSGILSNGTLNDIIRDLGNERINLGVNQPLPLSIKPNKKVQITDDSISCTFQQVTQPVNTNPLRDLGIYLEHIVDSFHTSDNLTINLHQMITAYNNAINGTDIPKISLPQTGAVTSRSGAVILPDYEDLYNDSQMIVIPMCNGNLTSLSDTQLTDLLVYIDSLRDSDGGTSIRFANLQNDITHELARRRINK